MAGNGSLQSAFHCAIPLIAKIRVYFDRLEAEAARIDPELAPAHRAFAQAALHPLILGAPFVHRTFTKPLGYAGDYQMVNQILGDPRQGPNTSERCCRNRPASAAFTSTRPALTCSRS
jgi:hypothetical protein